MSRRRIIKRAKIARIAKLRFYDLKGKPVSPHARDMLLSVGIRPNPHMRFEQRGADIVMRLPLGYGPGPLQIDPMSVEIRA